MILVDTSDSMPMPTVTLGMRFPNRNLVYEAATAAAARLGPDDRVLLGTFGATPRLMKTAVASAELEPYARDLAAQHGGPSPLWDERDANALAAKQSPLMARVRSLMDIWAGRVSND